MDFDKIPWGVGSVFKGLKFHRTRHKALASYADDKERLNVSLLHIFVTRKISVIVNFCTV
jgi:hypothetical protein